MPEASALEALALGLLDSANTVHSVSQRASGEPSSVGAPGWRAAPRPARPPASARCPPAPRPPGARRRAPPPAFAHGSWHRRPPARPPGAPPPRARPIVAHRWPLVVEDTLHCRQHEWKCGLCTVLSGCLQQATHAHHSADASLFMSLVLLGGSSQRCMQAGRL